MAAQSHVRAMPRSTPPKPEHTYSLSIFPKGDKADAMQAEIDSLAKQYGGKKVPVHVTLMGGIVDDQASAEERAKLLSSQLKVQKIFFDKVVSRPVTLHGKPVHSVAVSIDGEIGFGEFGALAHPTYVRTPMLPRVAHLHVSLLYSDSIDEATRDTIVAQAQERLLGPGGKLHPAEYEITELALVETTDDDPAKWPVLSTYPLQTGDPPGASGGVEPVQS